MITFQVEDPLRVNFDNLYDLVFPTYVRALNILHAQQEMIQEILFDKFQLNILVVNAFFVH